MGFSPLPGDSSRESHVPFPEGTTEKFWEEFHTQKALRVVVSQRGRNGKRKCRTRMHIHKNASQNTYRALKSLLRCLPGLAGGGVSVSPFFISYAKMAFSSARSPAPYFVVSGTNSRVQILSMGSFPALASFCAQQPAEALQGSASLWRSNSTQIPSRWPFALRTQYPATPHQLHFLDAGSPRFST